MLSSVAPAGCGSKNANFAVADVPSEHQLQLTLNCSNNPQPEHRVSNRKVLPSPEYIVSTLQAQHYWNCHKRAFALYLDCSLPY